MIQLHPRPLAIYSVVAMVAAGPAWGQDSETQALRKEVEELKQKVQKLEEQQTKTPAAAGTAAPRQKGSAAAASQAVPQQGVSSTIARGAEAQAAATSAQNSIIELRRSWSRVAKNMSQIEIADVLGQPTKETRIDGKRLWYYYYPGIGGSSVFFRTDGHVSSYQPPTTGWW